MSILAKADGLTVKHKGFREDPELTKELWRDFVDELLCKPTVPMRAHEILYDRAFSNWKQQQGPVPVWVPDDETVANSNIKALMDQLGIDDYDALYKWSVDEKEEYWKHAIRTLEIPIETPPSAVLKKGRHPDDDVWLPDATMNIVQACFRSDETQPAIIFASEEQERIQGWTYGRLHRMMDRVSHGLVSQGIKKGDKVALYMPMAPECVAAYLGIIQMGAVVVSIPDSFAAPEVKKRLRISKAKMVVTMGRTVRAGKPVGLYAKAVEAGAKQCIVVGPDRPVQMREEDVMWRDFLGPDEPFVVCECAAQDPINILFSSGTTGDPKAIAWDHLTPIKVGADAHYHQDIHEGEVVAWPTSIGWMMGPWLIFATLMNEGTLALFNGAPTTPAFMRFLRGARVNVLGVVPGIVTAWRHAGVRPHALPTVRIFSSTGEASDPDDYRWLMSLAGYKAPIIEYCGGTEIGGGFLTGTVVQPQSPGYFSTPALGSDMVVRGDDGKMPRPGQIGEVFLAPPAMGLSNALLNGDHREVYYKGVKKSSKGETLRRHGDMVRRLWKGYYQAQGRADDTMNLGGVKVGSAELESVFTAHADVVECAAVSVPIKSADHLVVAAVVKENLLEEPVEEETDEPEPMVVLAFKEELEEQGDEEVEPPALQRLQDELQELLKEHSNPLFKIHDVMIVEALPRTASGKVMRRELRDLYQKKPKELVLSSAVYLQ